MGSMIDLNNTSLRLDVSLYGELEKVTDTLSKCRVRIFYKGLNRNRTYISEEFANELIQSLPYTPVKGIFNYAEGDYEEHGEENDEGKIYGIVPENHNFAWEKHIDSDGVEREYATADVYLFTGLYDEAKIISGKSQSMEIFKDSLVGEWRIYDDKMPVFYFLHGSLVGLQVLGNSIEPCFEGSAFFNLTKDVKECINYIKQIQNLKAEGDKMELDKSLFRLSDNEKADVIFDLLNPKYPDLINYWVCEVYDDYALCREYDGKNFVRVHYTKEEDVITLGDKENVFITDVTESEYNALETMKAMSGSFAATNEKIAEMSNQITELEAEKTEFEAKNQELTEANTEFEAQIAEKDSKIAEFETQITENETKVAEFEAQLSEKDSKIAEFEAEKTALNSTIEELNEFKLNIEIEKKNNILDEFSTHLTDEQLNSLKSSMDKYSVSDFKKEVCVTAYESKDLFSNQEPKMLFKSNANKTFETGATKILKRYKNGGNK